MKRLNYKVKNYKKLINKNMDKKLWRIISNIFQKLFHLYLKIVQSKQWVVFRQKYNNI